MPAERDIDCIRTALDGAGISNLRAKEIVTRYRAARAEAAQNAPKAQAATQAQKKLAKDLQKEATERLRRAVKTAQLIAEYSDRVSQQITAPVKTSWLAGDRRARTPGVAMARAAISLIEADPRFPSISYSTHRESIRGRLLSRLDDELKIRKGVFGRQK